MRRCLCHETGSGTTEARPRRELRPLSPTGKRDSCATAPVSPRILGAENQFNEITIRRRLSLELTDSLPWRA
jgi:hypothetical protein